MDRTGAPRPRASACRPPPRRGTRRGAGYAAQEPVGPTSAAAAAGGGRTGRDEAGVAAGGGRTGTGAAGEAAAGRRGSGARNRPGRGRRRRGIAMDGPCGATVGGRLGAPGSGVLVEGGGKGAEGWVSRTFEKMTGAAGARRARKRLVREEDGFFLCL
jgi:hypothetical protein